MNSYVMSFNRVDGKIVRYSGVAQVELLGITDYVVIEADSYKAACEIYVEMRKQDKSEEDV